MLSLIDSASEAMTLSTLITFPARWRPLEKAQRAGIPVSGTSTRPLDKRLASSFAICLHRQRMPQQPTPYIDSDGNEFFNSFQAARIVEGVCDKTMWAWADARRTSFGFPLTVKNEIIRHHRTPKNTEAPPKNPRQVRMLILAADVFELRRILHEAGRSHPGPWSPSEMVRLEAAANRHRVGSVLSHS